MSETPVADALARFRKSGSSWLALPFFQDGAADAVAARWAGIGRTGAPVDTVYGLREGAHVDPDGNLLRFGSPLCFGWMRTPSGRPSPCPDRHAADVI